MDEPAITYFRTFGHYHRPRLLNGSVRNGNACFQPGMVTGKTRRTAGPHSSSWPRRRSLVRGAGVWQCSIDRHDRCAGRLVPSEVRRADFGDRTEMVKRSPISTGPLRVSPPLHFPPINLVVYEGARSKSYLEKGFALRCFQRLSLPHVATLRCLEQDNRNTRGASF